MRAFSFFNFLPACAAFVTIGTVMVCVLMVTGCSDQVISEEPEETFVEQMRQLTATHMEPNKEQVFLLMGTVGSEVREHSIASGTIDETDYVFFRDHPSIGKFGFDVLSEYDDVHESLGIDSAECSIPFDKPDKGNGAHALGEYAECVTTIIEACGTAFSYIDEDGQWVTHCMDPSSQVGDEERAELVRIAVVELVAAHVSELSQQQSRVSESSKSPVVVPVTIMAPDSR